MKKTQLAVSIALLTLSGVSIAENITMMTGSPTGSYNTIVCPAIGERVATQGVTLKCEPSAGTGENFDAIMANGSEVVGLGQLDVFGLKLNQAILIDEEAEEYMGNVGNMAPEALFCAASVNGRIPQGPTGFNMLSDDEPMDKPFKISTYAENSGSAGTLEFLRSSIPAVGSNTELVFKKNMKFEVELGRLEAGKRDAVCFVTFPNPEDSKIQMVVENENLFFVEFGSPELGNLKIGEVMAYQVTEVPVTGSVFQLIGKGEKAKTLTTGITLMLNVDELSSTAYNALVDAVVDPELIPADTIVGKLARARQKAMGAAMDVYNNVAKK